MNDLEWAEVREAELHRLVRYYRSEADRCTRARAHLAGCVMAAAALEAILLLMVNAYPEEAVATDQAPRSADRIPPSHGV
jgi:hypothetical protein